MKWLIATPGPGDRFLHVFRVEECSCCTVNRFPKRIRLVGRFDSIQMERGARLETGSQGLLHVFAADCVVPLPNCHGEITFTGTAV